MNLSISLSPEPWREQKRARRYTECCHDPTIDSSVRKCFLNIHSGWRWSSKKQERKTTRYTRTQTWSQNMPFFRVFPNNLSRYTYYSDMGWSSYIMILVTWRHQSIRWSTCFIRAWNVGPSVWQDVMVWMLALLSTHAGFTKFRSKSVRRWWEKTSECVSLQAPTKWTSSELLDMITNTHTQWRYTHIIGIQLDVAFGKFETVKPWSAEDSHTNPPAASNVHGQTPLRKLEVGYDMFQTFLAINYPVSFSTWILLSFSCILFVVDGFCRWFLRHASTVTTPQVSYWVATIMSPQT